MVESSAEKTIEITMRPGMAGDLLLDSWSLIMSHGDIMEISWG